MFELMFPWLLLLAPLPLLVYRFAPEFKPRRSGLTIPYFHELTEFLGGAAESVSAPSMPGRGQRWLLGLTWLLLLLALAKPQVVGEPVVQQSAGRDLMIAVDLSGSMEARDFTLKNGEAVDRLSALKVILREFVATRAQDRLGLIVFGDAPFLQSPFTADHQTWMTLLDETRIAMAGMSTVIGDAIGLSLKVFQNSDTRHRVLILLTDGNDTGSRVPPVEAARVAQQYGVTIYTIAIGDPQTQGEDAMDVETLERIATISGGTFYRALDRQELQSIYRKINALEPELYKSLSYYPRQSLHSYPVVLILLLWLGYGCSRAWRGRRRGERQWS